MIKKISFGTSGWRDIIADGFTFEKVRALTRAIAMDLKKRRQAKRGIVIGHDARFLSEEFTSEAAKIMSEEGIKVYLVLGPTPTPVLANVILDLKLAGGINFTASHNPAFYQGMKWSNQYGGPASKAEIRPIEEEANRILAQKNYKPRQAKIKGEIVKYNPKKNYFKKLYQRVNKTTLSRAKLKVIADPLYGAGRGYLAEALQQVGCQTEVVHNWRDTLFGGNNPEPDAENLSVAAALMQKRRYHLTLGTDGDADRFGVVDRDGTYITPNQVLALTLYLLVEHRKLKGRVVRSVVTSHLVDALAEFYGLEVEVTPVGFKYICESMVRGGFLVGGEESGGLTIVKHVPEKDGILACLLMAELVASEKQSLKNILKKIYKRVGNIFTDRINVKLHDLKIGPKLRQKLDEYTPQKLAGKSVVKVNRMDGYKYLLADDSWLAIRLSGTEPVARLYLEAKDIKTLKSLTLTGKKILTSV